MYYPYVIPSMIMNINMQTKSEQQLHIDILIAILLYMDHIVGNVAWNIQKEGIVHTLFLYPTKYYSGL